MSKESILKKMISWEELSNEEKLKASEWLLPKTDILPLNQISAEEKIEIAKSLVAEKVADILQNQMIISRLSWRKIDLTLRASECIDSNENIRKFLAILWASDINVSSDFPARCESYEWRTFIKFKF